MAQHNDLGKEGEEIGLRFLLEKGYKILATNWRYRQEEIDIIAMDKEELVIIEVKTRTSAFMEPELAVTRSKQKFLVNATAAYIEQNNINTDTRFDIISIVTNSKYQKINHIENAFYPGLSQ